MTNPQEEMMDSLKAGTFQFTTETSNIDRIAQALALSPVTDRNDADVAMTSSECVSLASKFRAGDQLVLAWKTSGHPTQLRPFEYAVLLYNRTTRNAIMELGYVPINQANAVAKAPADLIEKASGGDAEAQYKLGLYYGQRNVNLEAYNPKIAAQWLEKAAKQGHRDAQYKLGSLQASLGMEDPGASEKWFRKASEHGQLDAQTSLAFSLLQHHNPQARSEAISLLHKAAVQGDFNAMHIMDIYDLESKQTIAVWYEQAAMAGSKFAANQIAQCYEAGRGVPVNLDKAEHWYRVADSKIELAKVLVREKKFQEACRLSKEAAGAQPAGAESSLPFFQHPGETQYRNAQDYEKKGDYEKAAHLYEDARLKRAEDFNQSVAF